MKKLLVLLLFIASSYLLYGQGDIPVGTWRTHFPYRNTHQVAVVNDIIYASTESAIFSLQNNEVRIISKLNGLSDTGISALGAINNYLCIGYHNGNIDLLKDAKTTNLDFILKSSIQGGKQVHSFLSVNQDIFILTDFGVVILDSENLNVVDIYQELGADGADLAIYQGAVFQDSLFLATDSGIIAGSLDPSVNLKDFRNWRRYGPAEGVPASGTIHLTRFEQGVFTAFDNDSIYYYNGLVWTSLQDIAGSHFRFLGSTEERFFVIADSILYEQTSTGFKELSDNLIQDPNMALSSNGRTFITTTDYGLVTDQNGNYEAVIPDGPFSKEMSKLRWANGPLYVCSGGPTTSMSPQENSDGFYVFTEGAWTNYNAKDPEYSIPIPIFKDLTDAASFQDQVYFSSFGYGLLQWDGEDFTIINENTPGSLLENTSSGTRSVLVTSLSSDNAGIWMTNYEASSPYKVLRPDQTWEEYRFTEPGAGFPLKIAISPRGDKWVILDPEQGGGILVFNEESGQSRRLTTSPGNGDLPSNTVNEIVFDKEGIAWVATDQGVAFFPFTRTVLDDTETDAVIPIFESSLLFDNENVNTIEIDGGNRKWMATSGGAWLFDENLQALEAQFNTENSPLLSNYVKDIEIDGRTGEVFFLTDKGLISYRGTATESSDLHDEKIRIFPNPVRVTQHELVSISGLARNAIVKITDLSGSLVWQMRANGGTATWNVRDLDGNKPVTGIYLVLSSTEDGEDTIAGKLAIVN